LKQNYPNPFNPETTIDYRIPQNGKVKIVIYNSLGQKIRTLLSGEQMAGSHLVVWDGTNDMGQKVGSGIYFYSLNFDDRSIVKKMILAR
jgi:flagellar hook assembly protein FlgD